MPSPMVVASAATGAVDFAITGTPSAGVAAPLLAALVRLGADARSSRQQRGARVLEAAAQQVGGLDRLADLATADDARLELTARVDRGRHADDPRGEDPGARASGVRERGCCRGACASTDDCGRRLGAASTAP